MHGGWGRLEVWGCPPAGPASPGAQEAPQPPTAGPLLHLPWAPRPPKALTDCTELSPPHSPPSSAPQPWVIF